LTDPILEVQDQASVAICMATYDPPLELFRRQIESIRGQTHTDWHCYISDDHSGSDIFNQIRSIVGADCRFTMSRRATRLGFYRNFQCSLELVAPSQHAYVALADQDDRWYPDKLSVLLHELRPGVNLVYSDLRIVDTTGRISSESYWTSRSNNFTDYFQMFFANTVTGATSLFRAELLPQILPFPRSIGAAFHDQWISLVAMSIGEIAYVDQPLQDYIQHDSSVIGHAVRPGRTHEARQMLPTRKNLSRAWAKGQRAFEDDLRIKEFARELIERLGLQLSDERKAALEKLAVLGDDIRSTTWMAARAAVSLINDDVTMGAERRLFAGLVWSRLNTIASWLSFSPFRAKTRDLHH